MGHIERQRIRATQLFVSQLADLKIPSGCLHSSILAMGGLNIHLHDVVELYDNRTGVPNLDAYLYKQGLSLGSSVKIDGPLSLAQTRMILDNPKHIFNSLGMHQSTAQRVVGVLFAFGEYLNEPPHVIGILPRGDMTRNLRTILKEKESYVVIDTSNANDPVYSMSVRNIAENLNAFILNGIDVSLHIVTRL